MDMDYGTTLSPVPDFQLRANIGILSFIKKTLKRLDDYISGYYEVTLRLQLYFTASIK
jgi:hypothetical protein